MVQHKSICYCCTYGHQILPTAKDTLRYLLHVLISESYQLGDIDIQGTADRQLLHIHIGYHQNRNTAILAFACFCQAFKQSSPTTKPEESCLLLDRSICIVILYILRITLPVTELPVLPNTTNHQRQTTPT